MAVRTEKAAERPNLLLLAVRPGAVRQQVGPSPLVADRREDLRVGRVARLGVQRQLAVERHRKRRTWLRRRCSDRSAGTESFYGTSNRHRLTRSRLFL